MWPQHTYVSPQECAHYFLDNPATEEDMQAVEQQLGRYPRGMIAVGARCVCGSESSWSSKSYIPCGGCGASYRADRAAENR